VRPSVRQQVRDVRFVEVVELQSALGLDEDRAWAGRLYTSDAADD
jgi:hypothetical protein